MAVVSGEVTHKDPTPIADKQEFDPEHLEPIAAETAKNIRVKQYGKDVRESVARSIEVHLLAAQAMHDEQVTFSADQSKRQAEVEKRQDTVEKTFQAIIEDGADDLEIIDARTDTDNELHKTLDDRISADVELAMQHATRLVTELVGGAPETLDTIKELADAVTGNQTLVDAIDAAITKKADKTLLEDYQKTEIIGKTAYEKKKAAGTLENKFYLVGDDLE